MHGETVLVRSLILEHPQARSSMAQPSLVTPSMIQLREQGGSLSTRLVMFGADAADTVRAAAKRRTKSWNREAIVDMDWLSMVERQHMEKERFDNPRRRKMSSRDKMSTIIMDSQRATTATTNTTDGRDRARPIPVPYSTNQTKALASRSLPHTSAPNVHDARCHLTPTQTRGARNSILVLSSRPKPKWRNF
jgi:hypothetical protein